MKYLGRVVVHVVEPSVPGRSHLLGSQEPLSVVCVLHPTTSVLVRMIEILVVAVAKLVIAHTFHDILSVAAFLMSPLVGLATKEGTSEALFAVNLPELGSKEPNELTPRSH